MSYITPDDEKSFMGQFTYNTYNTYNTYESYDTDKQIQICGELEKVFGDLDIKEMNDLTSSERFLDVMKQYCKYVPYDDHIQGSLESYHDKEIQAWEEADKLFPAIRKNMRREFYFDQDEDEGKIEKENMNDVEKAWHDYVDKSLHKARIILEAMVPPRLRRSYVFEFW